MRGESAAARSPQALFGSDSNQLLVGGQRLGDLAAWVGRGAAFAGTLPPK